MNAPIRKFNISTKEGADQKVFWHKVGELVEWEGKDGEPNQFSLKMFMLETKFYVFEDKPKVEGTGQAEADGNEINIDDVPF